ncbi:hypothetical protein AAVH_39012 [Aphelenchoides avenae]|nr:hypothetical protein AAVH_39012 [Aphelenchus avenae]
MTKLLILVLSFYLCASLSWAHNVDPTEGEQEQQVATPDYDECQCPCESTDSPLEKRHFPIYGQRGPPIGRSSAGLRAMGKRKSSYLRFGKSGQSELEELSSPDDKRFDLDKRRWRAGGKRRWRAANGQ